MKIGIANDHRGYTLKKQLETYLKNQNYEVTNFGTDTEEAVDYPEYAFKVGEAIQRKQIDFGILICGTGIGMSIAANKVSHVRCAKVDTVKEAEITRSDNDANVIAIGASKSFEDAKAMIDVFLKTMPSLEERHVRRRAKIGEYEDEH